MILVDSSVWIDYFRGTDTAQANILHALLGAEELAVGDLVVAEVLQGIDLEASAQEVERLLTSLTVFDLGGREAAVAATYNFRQLRRKGVTVRKTIDSLIATYCIRHGHSLLHNDRDFDPFEKHLGLRTVSA